MADFFATVSGLPGVKELSDPTIKGLVDQVVADVVGAHRWPFLLVTDRELAWTANSATQSYPDIARIENLKVPGTTGKYYALTELSDKEFAHFQGMSPYETTKRFWRDCGMDGNKLILEIFAVPTSAITVKCDYIMLPATNTIDTLPSRFQRLVTLGVQAATPNSGKTEIDYFNELQRVIAREESLKGSRRKIGMGFVQAARFRNANNPT